MQTPVTAAEIAEMKARWRFELQRGPALKWESILLDALRTIADLESARAALRRYGRHDSDCWTQQGGVCICGFSLDRAHPREGEEGRPPCIHLSAISAGVEGPVHCPNCGAIWDSIAAFHGERPTEGERG